MNPEELTVPSLIEAVATLDLCDKQEGQLVVIEFESNRPRVSYGSESLSWGYCCHGKPSQRANIQVKLRFVLKL